MSANASTRTSNQECFVRSKYQGQGPLITPHSICGVYNNLNCRIVYGTMGVVVFLCGLVLYPNCADSISLQWRHNERNGVSNHQRLFMHRSKKTSKFRVTGLCEGDLPVTDEFPHKWPLTRKMFPFDDVIMCALHSICLFCHLMVVMFLVWFGMSSRLEGSHGQFHVFCRIHGSISIGNCIR